MNGIDEIDLFGDGGAGALDELDRLREENARLALEVESRDNELIDLREQVDELRRGL